MPLMILIMAFQAVCMVLMAFKDGDVNRFCLIMAFALPLGTWGLTYGINKLIYADKALILLTAFLAGLGVITLRAVLTSSAKAVSQAMFLPLGCAFMLIGALGIHFIRIRGWMVWLIMAVCVVLMVMPFGFTTASSAKSWIRIAGYQMQPSEFVKPALTTIDPKIREMAEEALRLARGIKDGTKTKSRIIEGEFVPGESAIHI